MLGILVKQYMKDNGIKQAFIAEKMGITPQILGQMLNGNRKMSATEYFSLCAAMGVDISKFAIEAGLYKPDTAAVKQ